MDKVVRPKTSIEFFGGPYDGELVRVCEDLDNYDIPLGGPPVLRVQRYVRTNLKRTSLDGTATKFVGMTYQGEVARDPQR